MQLDGRTGRVMVMNVVVWGELGGMGKGDAT